MNKKIITLFIILLTLPQMLAQDNNMNLPNNIIDKIKTKYAPDKRTALFNIETNDSSGVIVLTGETNITKAKEELLADLERENISFEDKIVFLPSEELGENIYGVVNLSVANLRSKPFHSAELATQALLGTPVKVLKKGDGFYLIQTPDNYISWVDNSGINIMNKDEIDQWNSSKKIIYMPEYGFSYSEPDVASEHVSDLTAGNILINEGEENGFYEVIYPDGRTAFVQKEKCSDLNNWLNETLPTEDKIISTAERFLGIPYLWGGTSTKGVDCSGFTKTVYFLNGVILQRDASQQVNDGVLVDTEKGFNNLRPGDLLFFGDKQTEEKKERITHVGIYKGNNEFIHSSGRVTINSLDSTASNFSEYRLNHFIRAKRIINSIDKNGITTIKNNEFYSGELK